MQAMQKKYDTGVMWFRRDLRLTDNAALYHALKSCQQVHCLFVFDREILDRLPRQDRRVEFIRESLAELDEEIRALADQHGAANAGLVTVHATASNAVPELAAKWGATAVFANRDYEPQALERDAKIEAALLAQGAAFYTFKDHVVFERNEVLTLASKPYSVFTPYKNSWLKKIDA